MNGAIRYLIFLIFFNSFAQNDTLLFKDNKKEFFKKTQKLLTTAASYNLKTEPLLNNYLNEKINYKIKKLYIKYLRDNLKDYYFNDIQKIFFAYFDDQNIRFSIINDRSIYKKDSLRIIRKKIDKKNITILKKININKIRSLIFCSNEICSEILQSYFILIQHTNLKLMKLNLPFFLELTELKLLKKSALALMIDRIEIEEHRPQIYGTQVYFDKLKNSWKLFEIIDETNVNVRRNDIGLEQIKDYLLTFGINYEKPN